MRTRRESEKAQSCEELLRSYDGTPFHRKIDLGSGKTKIVTADSKPGCQTKTMDIRKTLKADGQIGWQTMKWETATITDGADSRKSLWNTDGRSKAR